MTKKSLKVTLGTKKRLERLKKGEFKRKFKVRSLNDVIDKLLDIYDEYVIIKNTFKGTIQTGQISEKTLKEFPKTKEQWLNNIREESEDIREHPDICPDCARYPRCTREWIHDPEEVEANKCFIPANQCYFRSIRDDSKIDCAKDFAQKGKIHIVSVEFCRKCWERKKRHFKKQEKEENGVIRHYCGVKDTTFIIKKETDFLQLPCLKDPMFKCKSEKCHEHVLKLIKKENKE